MATRSKPRRKRPFQGTLGTGERFARCVDAMRRRQDVRDPAALCAWIGRRKYGRAGFAALGQRGRVRRNPSVDGYLVVLWQDAGTPAPHRTVLYDGASRASASRTFRDAAHSVRAASRDGIFRMVQFYAVVPDARDRQRAVLIDEVWGGGRSARSRRARATVRA